jgi:hypothetical protein
LRLLPSPPLAPKILALLSPLLPLLREWLLLLNCPEFGDRPELEPLAQPQVEELGLLQEFELLRLEQEPPDLYPNEPHPIDPLSLEFQQPKIPAEAQAGKQRLLKLALMSAEGHFELQRVQVPVPGVLHPVPAGQQEIALPEVPWRDRPQVFDSPAC